MNVKEIMTEKVYHCRPNDTLATVAGMMRRRNCGFVPVVTKDGIPVGVITDRDVCMAVATDKRFAADIEAQEIMSNRIFVCSPEDDIKLALERMRETKVRRLPVVNYQGKLEGILSLDDIVLSIREEGKDDSPINDIFSAYRSICEPCIAKRPRVWQ